MIALLALFGTAADASERDGFWCGMGLGVGANGLAPDAIAGVGSVVAEVRAGFAVSESVLLGPELAFIGQYNEWAEDVHVASLMTDLLFTGNFYPIENPFALSVGAGWASALQVDRGFDFDGSALVDGTGFNGVSWMAGVGYDFVSGGKGGIGARLRYDGQAFANDFGTNHGVALELQLTSY